MARRQGIQSGWLLMCYLAVREYSRCELVICATRDLVEESGKDISNLHHMILEPARRAVQALDNKRLLARRDRASTPSFYKAEKVSKKGLFNTRYAVSPLFSRSTLFSVHAQNNTARDGDTLSLRRELQHPAQSQSFAAESPLTVTAQERSETAAESKQTPYREHTEASLEEPSPARSQQPHHAVSQDPDHYDFIIVGCGAAGCPLASYLALKGEGMAIADEAISQPYATRKGVRTHVAAVMGGGTAIDLAIYVEETKEYFDYLNERYPAYKFQWPAIQQAYRYVRKVVAHKMPRDTRFGHEYGRALRARGFHPLGGREPPEYSSSIQRIEFDTSQRPPRAKCVVYRPTSYGDVKPQGINFGQTLPASSAGIGPLHQLNEIGAPVIVDNPHVGQKFSDRVFIPISAFTADYADEITPLPSKPIRRMVSLGGARTHNKRPDPSGASTTWRHALRENNSANDSFFLSRTSDTTPAGVPTAVRTKRVFGMNSVAEINHGALEEKKPSLGESKGRGADLHYRRMMLPPHGSSPITTLSRDIPEEGQLPVPRTVPENSPAVPATQHTPTTIDDILVTESRDSADSGVNPSRVVLVDFKNSLSPEITGRFVDVRYPQEGLLDPPRVCQAMGLKQGGPPGGCTAGHYSIGKRTLTCSLLVAEETSGGRAQEGVVLSTRFVFPPALRNDPFVDVLFEILGACGDYKQPYGLPVFQPLCAIVMPVIKCFRKALASFHFIAEPKSRGFVRLRSDGAVEIEGNYLKEEQDLFDAVRGVSSLIATINDNTYRLAPRGLGDTIQNYLQDMLPEKHRRLRRIISLDREVKPRKLVATAVEEMPELDAYYQDGQEEPNEFVLEDYQDFVIANVDEKKLEELGYKRKLEKIGFDFESYQRHTSTKGSRTPGIEEESPRWFAARRVLQEMIPEDESDPATKRKMHGTVPAAPLTEPMANVTKQQLEDAEKACKMPCAAVTGEGACAAADICCAAFGNSMCIRTVQGEALERQLRDELHKARHQTYDSTPGDSNGQPHGTTDTSQSGDASEQCAGGLESCVLRAVHHNGLIPTAVDEVWGLMERLPAAGASLLKSFLQVNTSTGLPGDGTGVHSASRPSSSTAAETALPGSTQWAATFPPRLPDPYNPRDVARYVLTHMSSVWHHCNTAPTGLVVNSDFEVNGTKGLSIVDASVLNQMTRMNPLATLLMLGTYAGMVKLRKRGLVDIMPPAEALGNPTLQSVLPA